MRSCLFNRIFDERAARDFAARANFNRHDVDAPVPIELIVGVEKGLRGGDELGTLGGRDRFFGCAQPIGLPGAHFHEDHLIAALGHQIELAHGAVPVPFKDDIAVRGQILSVVGFAAFAQ